MDDVQSAYKFSSWEGVSRLPLNFDFYRSAAQPAFSFCNIFFYLR